MELIIIDEDFDAAVEKLENEYQIRFITASVINRLLSIDGNTKLSINDKGQAFRPNPYHLDIYEMDYVNKCLSFWGEYWKLNTLYAIKRKLNSQSPPVEPSPESK